MDFNSITSVGWAIFVAIICMGVHVAKAVSVQTDTLKRQILFQRQQHQHLLMELSWLNDQAKSDKYDKIAKAYDEVVAEEKKESLSERERESLAERKWSLEDQLYGGWGAYPPSGLGEDSDGIRNRCWKDWAEAQKLLR